MDEIILKVTNNGTLTEKDHSYIALLKERTKKVIDDPRVKITYQELEKRKERVAKIYYNPHDGEERFSVTLRIFADGRATINGEFRDKWDLILLRSAAPFRMRGLISFLDFLAKASRKKVNALPRRTLNVLWNLKIEGIIRNP